MIYIGLAIGCIALIIALVVLCITLRNQRNRNSIGYHGGYNAENGFKSDGSSKIFKGLNNLNQDTYCVGSGNDGGEYIECRLYDAQRQYTYDFYLYEGSSVQLGREESKKNQRNYQWIAGDGTISKEHCIVSYWNGYVIIEDTNSANHTYVNGNIIQEQTILRPNDSIQIGNTRLIIMYS